MNPINITNFGSQVRAKTEEGLQHLLADMYVASVLARNLHWNVVGPNFNAMHKMFEDHYTELNTAIDELAERIRAVGATPLSTMREFLAMSCISEPETYSDIDGTLATSNMLSAYSTLTRRAKDVLEFAEAAKDVATVDLLTRRIVEQDKIVWMLRSILPSDVPPSPDVQ